MIMYINLAYYHATKTLQDRSTSFSISHIAVVKKNALKTKAIHIYTTYIEKHEGLTKTILAIQSDLMIQQLSWILACCCLIEQLIL